MNKYLEKIAGMPGALKAFAGRNPLAAIGAATGAATGLASSGKKEGDSSFTTGMKAIRNVGAGAIAGGVVGAGVQKGFAVHYDRKYNNAWHAKATK